MSDKFIYAAMPQPSREFTDALWARLATEKEKPQPKSRIRIPSSPLRRVWRLAAASFVVLAALVVAVPPLRSAALQAISTIAGIEFDQTQEYPYEQPIQYNELRLGLDEARASLPFTFELPTWTPDGYALQPEVMILLGESVSEIAAATNVYVYWRNDRGNNLILIAQVPELADCPTCLIPVGSDSTVEVSVNGLPAALTRGAWNVDSETWDENGMISLRWHTDQALYMLTAVEASISEEQLIRIAESIPER